MVNERMLITSIVLFCLLLVEKSAAQNVEVGIISSPRYAGAAVHIPMKSGACTVLRCCSDIMETISGSKSPGIMADWHLLFPVSKMAAGEGVTLTLNAGAGFAAGRVRDFHKSAGVLCGVSTLFYGKFEFQVPVSVSVGISGILGCHMTSENKFSNTMTLYRNGLTRIWIPEITISYRFR